MALKQVALLLFDEFETLDVFGPVEILGQLPAEYKLEYYSLAGGIICSSQQVAITTKPLSELAGIDILFIPGGWGVRQEVNNAELLRQIGLLAAKAQLVLSVCTGSALLAKAGCLDNLQATTNKLAYDWVISLADHVLWQRNARWVRDGKYYTASGVSAGIDMALGFVADQQGLAVAQKIAYEIEYIWNDDPYTDPFA